MHTPQQTHLYCFIHMHKITLFANFERRLSYVASMSQSASTDWQRSSRVNNRRRQKEEKARKWNEEKEAIRTERKREQCGWKRWQIWREDGRVIEGKCLKTVQYLMSLPLDSHISLMSLAWLPPPSSDFCYRLRTKKKKRGYIKDWTSLLLCNKKR